MLKSAGRHRFGVAVGLRGHSGCDQTIAALDQRITQIASLPELFLYSRASGSVVNS
jgi:hypothetical protein